MDFRSSGRAAASFPVLFLALASFLSPRSVHAAELPRAATLNSILRQLDRLDPQITLSLRSPPGPESAEFGRGGRTNATCGMQQFQMVLTNDTDHTSNAFSVLLDVQTPGNTVVPHQLLARTRILHVDADGSPRAYHPLDPRGRGSCTLLPGPSGGFVPSGVCALDTFSNGGITLFKGSTKLTGAELERQWRDFWPLIRDKRITPFDLSHVTDRRPRSERYQFHWPERNLTAFFKRGNIPQTDDGYPCVRGEASRFKGYFVAATSLKHDRDQGGVDGGNPAGIAPAECRPLQYIDAETVPFFVLPGGGVGNVKVGDAVVVRVKTGGGDTVVYGVAADAGPTQSFGEGSVALIQALLGNGGAPVVNNDALNRLDIGTSRGVTVDILVLGGTKALLQGNYTRSNVETIAKREFEKWNGEGNPPMQRLNSCTAQTGVNPPR